MAFWRQKPDRQKVVIRLLKELTAWHQADKEVQPTTRLEADLGMDSLAKVALAYRLEEELGVDLQPFSGDLADICTVEDVLNIIDELLSSEQEETSSSSSPGS